MVRDYVRVRRAQIDLEAGRRVEVFVPQEHAPGAEPEVDFGEVRVTRAGVKSKCDMSTFSSHTREKLCTGCIRRKGRKRSSKDISPRSTRSWCLSTRPTRHIRYDQFDQRSAESELRADR